MKKEKVQTVKVDGNFLWNIPIQIVPKARPKFGRGGAYMPKTYRENQNEIITHVLGLFSDSLAFRELDGNLQIVKCEMDITYYGHARGDGDNITGAIWDAMVKSKVLKNDNVNNIGRFSFTYGGKSQNPNTWVSVSQIDLRPIKN